MDEFSESDHTSQSSTNDAGSPAADGEEFEFKAQLQECLNDMQYDGTFSTFQTHATYTNPGLFLQDYGTVGLPLAVRDAEGIAAICKQSPFGKGDHTIIDTSVRRTWELDASAFRCENPRWTTFLDSLANQTKKDLGIQADFRLEPYKLLLYEEGAFFKAHRDSEKVPGMFGTLVVCLPSQHTGGDVRLVHDKTERTFETSPTSAFDLSALAWYSDVEHEVRQVTSGYRLVLTYNLVQDQAMPKPTAAALDDSHMRLERLLASWKADFAHLDKLVYPLEHQYTPASLSLQSLKGHDVAKGKYVEHLCPKNGFHWFLGRLTKEEASEDYDDGMDGELGTFSLNHIVTSTGTSLGMKLEVNMESHLLADLDNLYEDRDADSEDEGEFTGNESMPASYRYHDAVCTIPKFAVEY
jgi:hypothetical protein